MYVIAKSRQLIYDTMIHNIISQFNIKPLGQGLPDTLGQTHQYATGHASAPVGNIGTLVDATSKQRTKPAQHLKLCMMKTSRVAACKCNNHAHYNSAYGLQQYTRYCRQMVGVGGKTHTHTAAESLMPTETHCRLRSVIFTRCLQRPMLSNHVAVHVRHRSTPPQIW